MFEILLGSLLGLFGFTQTVDTKPQPQGTVNLTQQLTPNGPLRESVQLEPMSQVQFRNVIRQAYDYSCGSAALTTLLDYYLGRNLEERQVMEGLLQRGIAFSAQGHGAIVRSIGVNVRHQVARVAFEATRKRLERHVDFAHVGNLTRLGGEVVAHESVEVHNISSLAKGPFHRAPVGFVQISL